MSLINLPIIDPPDWVQINKSIKLLFAKTPMGDTCKVVLNSILWLVSISCEEIEMDWNSPWDPLAREEIFIQGNCNVFYLEIAGDRPIDHLSSFIAEAYATGKTVAVDISHIGRVEFCVVSFERSMSSMFDAPRDTFSLRSSGAIPGVTFGRSISSSCQPVSDPLGNFFDQPIEDQKCDRREDHQA